MMEFYKNNRSVGYYVLMSWMLVMASAIPATAFADSQALAAEPSAFQTRMGQQIDGYASGSHPMNISSRSGMPNFWSLLWRIFVSLAMVIGAVLGCAYLWKNLAGGPLKLTPSGLRVLSRIQMTTKSSVYILEAVDRILIIGEHPNGLTCLTEMTDIVEVEKARRRLGATKPPADTPFEHNLEKARQELYPPQPLDRVMNSLTNIKDFVQSSQSSKRHKS